MVEMQVSSYWSRRLLGGLPKSRLRDTNSAPPLIRCTGRFCAKHVDVAAAS